MANINAFLKYLPIVAAIYAVYEAYGSRGLSGFLADLKNLPNVLRDKEAMNQLCIGIGILLIGSFLVSKFAPRGWIKYLTYAALYYFAVTQIATAISSCAGRGGYTSGNTGYTSRMVQ